MSEYASASAASDDLRLTIDRMVCRLNRPAGAQDPAWMQDRLGRLVERQVPRTCGQALSSLPGDDGAVYRIRRLRLHLWLDLQGMTEVEIAERWGRLLAAATTRTMRRGGPQQVIRFDSPRLYVTAFLRDLLDGRAWSRWYFAEFRPLQRLSTAAIAVQLLAARPDWLVPVMTELSISGHAARLIERWQGDHIAQLWSALGFSRAPVFAPQAPGAAQMLAQLTALWPDVGLAGAPDSTVRARDRLRLYLALGAARPAMANDPAWAGLLHALIDLAALLQLEPDLAPVLLMESGLYPAALKRIAASPVADALGWLVPLSDTATGRRHLARLTNVVTTVTEHREIQGPEGRPNRQLPERALIGRRNSSAALSSPVGSVFLLAPALAQADLWERWREERGEKMARCYLFVVALKALGCRRAPLSLGDKMLAAFAGLDAPPVSDARIPLEADGPPGAWAADLPELAARWYPAHERKLIGAEVDGLHVLKDPKAGHWLAAWPASAATGANKVGQNITLPHTEATEAELAALEAEAKYLQLGQCLGYPWLTPSLDAALSAATSLMLRRTAAWLPRFSQASPSYLARNFLALPATLHYGPDALTVQLSGGPLGVVLRLAALPESIDLAWLPQPLRLRLPGSLGAVA